MLNASAQQLPAAILPSLSNIVCSVSNRYKKFCKYKTCAGSKIRKRTKLCRLYSALKLCFPARIATIVCLWIFSGVQELRSVFQTALSSPAPLLSFVSRVELFSLNMLYFGHEIVD